MHADAYAGAVIAPYKLNSLLHFFYIFRSADQIPTHIAAGNYSFFAHQYHLETSMPEGHW